MRPATKIIANERVRRIAHSGSATIQSFLHHMRSAGIDYVPEPLLLAGQVEELSYLPGHCYQPTGWRPPEAWRIDHLGNLGAALRRCHDASVGFLAQHASADWFPFPEPCDQPDVICHNDLGPWNVPVDGMRVAIIDWEMAAPGRRLWDVAGIAWNWVPFLPPGERVRVGFPEPWTAEERLARLLEGYGEDCWTMRDLLEEVLRRQARVLDLVALSASTGAVILENWGKVDRAPILADRDFVHDFLADLA